MTQADAIQNLKNETSIGDKYMWYYGKLHPSGKREYAIRCSDITKTVTRFTDKSVWIDNSRISWNTLLDLLNKKTYQKKT